jgi:tRNA(Ile)-lysidine synthase
LEVRALGEAGIALCRGWRETGRPRASILGSPAVWRGADLVAAPLARAEPAWTATTEGGSEGFFRSILSH